jgi:LemA protein
LYGIGIYNALVAGRNGYKNGFAQIDVQLRRRYDLIPNLVEAAKGYLRHERETLEAITQARSQAQSAAQVAATQPDDARALTALGSAEGLLGAALGRFYAVAEAYPELKADAALNDLMTELSTAENKIALARQHFNEAVTDYNNRREQFPDNLIAAMFAFKAAQLLEFGQAEMREPPAISFA